MDTIESLIPVSGPGFVTNNRTANSHYATKIVHDLLISIASVWHKEHPNNPISIGQLSKKGGGSFEESHHQHRNGVEADVRPFRRDAQNAETHFNSSDYSQELTREFVELLRAKAKMHRVWFNDPILKGESLTTHADGHGNHLHLWFEDEQDSAARELKRGDVGFDVKRLQRKLIAAGFPVEGGADKKFGGHTEDAVKGFQAAHPPLHVNGIADAATQEALGV